jgi:phosphoribosylformylglycinamidine synthase
MIGVREGYDAPPLAVTGEGVLLEVGARGGALGGSEYLARVGGSDRFPDLPADAAAAVEAVAAVAELDSTRATHDVSHGGLAVTLAEMVSAGAGVDASVDGVEALFDETPGRVVVETTDPDAVRAAVGDVPVRTLGETTADATLSLSVGDATLTRDATAIRAQRSVIDRELE